MPTKRQLKPLAVAVAGLGKFAAAQHLPNVQRLGSAVLRGLCNRSEHRLAALAERYPVLVCTSNYQELLADDALDVVIIAAADAVQAEMTIQALEAGKHVFVEKPLAETPAGIAAVEEAQAKSGKRVAVGFNRRFAPIMQDLQADLSENGGFTNAQYRFVDDACIRWGTNLEAGSFIVHDCCHLFDLMQWLSGSQVKAVACMSARPDDETMILQLANQAVVSIQLSGHTCMELPKEQAAWYGTGGAWEMTDFVELRSYGFAHVPERRTYAGHSRPGGEFGHTYWYEQLGADALRAQRRQVAQLRQQRQDGTLPPEHEAEIENYLAGNIPTFSVDKGWLQSLDTFFRSIQNNVPSQHATPADALQASRIAAAVVASRSRGGELVAVDSIS
jgi:predicted dehydrogenase